MDRVDELEIRIADLQVQNEKLRGELCATWMTNGRFCRVVKSVVFGDFGDAPEAIKSALEDALREQANELIAAGDRRRELER